MRRATRDDAVSLAELARRTFFETFSADNRPADVAAHVRESFGADIQARELDDPALTYLIAEVGGRPAGYALVGERPAPECVRGSAPVELVRFYVDRPWQGAGVAQALMAAAEQEARRRGGRTLWLGVWERNPRAIAFYLKCGFADVGSHGFQLGSDPQTDRVMARDLSTGPGGG